MTNKHPPRQQMSAEELRAEILRRLPGLSVQELGKLDQYLDSLDTGAGTATEQPA